MAANRPVTLYIPLSFYRSGLETSPASKECLP